MRELPTMWWHLTALPSSLGPTSSHLVIDPHPKPFCCSCLLSCGTTLIQSPMPERGTLLKFFSSFLLPLPSRLPEPNDSAF